MKITGVLLGVRVKEKSGRLPAVWIDLEGLRVRVRDPTLLEVAKGLVHQEVVASVSVRYFRDGEGRWFARPELQALWPAK